METFAKKIVIFASGKGSNAKNIIKYFRPRDDVKIAHVLSNNKNAKVLQKAHRFDVSALYFDRAALYDSKEVYNILKDTNPDLIVLAGFLWLLPEKILHKFPNKIINIHPALLPKYGGKGMYGDKVHQAVVENKELKTGISIHYVNENYDEGEIIAQFYTDVSSDDSPKQVAKKVKALEKEHFPKVIDEILFPKK